MKLGWGAILMQESITFGATQLIDDAYPLRVRVDKSSKLLKSSDLLIDQIRSIDNKRLIDGPLYHCDRSLMQIVYEAVGEVMGVDLAK